MDWNSQTERTRARTGRNAAGVVASGRGFTLVDVLVSLLVISVLIGILLPSISRVRESAHRVICGSNLRQIGLGLHMYAQSSGEVLPPSVFLPATMRGPVARTSGDEGSPERMDTVRTSSDEFDARPWGDWDGLGMLYEGGYLSASKVFYCPSHAGSHAYERYTNTWEQSAGEIVSNFQYRGTGPDGQRRLYNIESSAALVTDMLRSYADLNHKGGFNVLAAGLSVGWVTDRGDAIADILLRTAGDSGRTNSVQDAWVRLDGGNDATADDLTDTN